MNVGSILAACAPVAALTKCETLGLSVSARTAASKAASIIQRDSDMLHTH